MSEGAAKPAVWTIGDVLRWATDDFRGRGLESPRLDAEVLLAFALGTNRIGLITDARRPLEPAELSRFRELVKRRRGREPVAYLRGEREFFGRTFKVDKRVLVPRPDTEVLVQVALERSAGDSLGARVLDLCTGSGCVAITYARERPTALVLGTDLSEDALVVARANAYRLGAHGVGFFQGDLFEALSTARFASRPRSIPRHFDVITANPPYIATAEIGALDADVQAFEPRLALDGGDDGLHCLRRVVGEAPAYLAPEGVLAVEVGAGEAPAVAQLFKERGFDDVSVVRDYGKIERVVSGKAPARSRVGGW